MEIPFRNTKKVSLVSTPYLYLIWSIDSIPDVVYSIILNIEILKLNKKIGSKVIFKLKKIKINYVVLYSVR